VGEERGAVARWRPEVAAGALAWHTCDWRTLSPARREAQPGIASVERVADRPSPCPRITSGAHFESRDKARTMVRCRRRQERQERGTPCGACSLAPRHTGSRGPRSVRRGTGGVRGPGVGESANRCRDVPTCRWVVVFVSQTRSVRLVRGVGQGAGRQGMAHGGDRRS
jgi:hypothetical protein